MLILVGGMFLSAFLMRRSALAIMTAAKDVRDQEVYEQLLIAARKREWASVSMAVLGIVSLGFAFSLVVSE